MKDTVFASHLLYHKEHGYSVLYLLRKSTMRYLILFLAFIVLFLLYCIGYLDISGILFISGLVIGGVARDAGWFLQGKRLWPLYEQVIDWSKVRQIAEKETTDPPSEHNLTQ
jgi:hypothetical protein